MEEIMYKDATFKEKFSILEPWIPSIIETIKKDLKHEHLKKDFVFVKTYFPSKNLNKITTEELVKAYTHAISFAENGETLGEFLTNRWLLQNGDIYDFFEHELMPLSADFTSLNEIEATKAQEIMQKSVELFGAEMTYLFAVLNSVVFPSEIYSSLKEQAETEGQNKQIEKSFVQRKEQEETVQKTHEREIARLTDKYEKKLAGLKKKYINDVEMFKKQIANLQRKLDGKKE